MDRFKAVTFPSQFPTLYFVIASMYIFYLVTTGKRCLHRLGMAYVFKRMRDGLALSQFLERLMGFCVVSSVMETTINFLNPDDQAEIVCIIWGWQFK